MRRLAVVVLALVLGTGGAAAQVRIITETGRQPPALDGRQAVLFLQRSHAVVGDCGTPDAGPVVDGPVVDAGAPVPDATPAAPDAGLDASPGPADGGIDRGDGGVVTWEDGGPGLPPDGGGCTVFPGPAITMVVQPRFTTAFDGTRFAVLVATPAPPLISTANPQLFAQLEAMSAPRVEVIEKEVQDPALGEVCESGCGGGGDTGGGCVGEPGYAWDPPDIPDGGIGDGVQLVGPYEVVRLEVADRAALSARLTALGYAHTQVDLDAIAPYVARGDAITAVRVAVEASGERSLVPLAFTWPGAEVRVPLALVAPGVGQAAWSVYVAAPGRYDVPGAGIRFAKRTRWSWDVDFVTRSDVVVRAGQPIGEDPVPARVWSDPTFEEVVYREAIVRVPVRNCDAEVGCCGSTRHVRPDLVLVVGAVGLVVRRRRRRAR